MGAGIESAFPRYALGDKIITSGKVTTLAQFSIASENRLTVVPDDTPNELCALLGCGLTTALGVIDNEANLKFGESVVIVGCGGIGLNLITGASMHAANPIIAIDTNQIKQQKCLDLKADYFINSSVADDVAKLSQLLPNGADVIIDTTGIPNVIASMIPYLSATGRMILVAQPPPNMGIEIPSASNLFAGQGQLIKATQGGQTIPQTDIPRYVNLHKAGKLNLTGLVTHWFDLANINDAFELLRTGNAGRIMINMTTQGEQNG